MADGDNPSFQTTREPVESNSELQWGSSEGKSWSKVIESSTGVTVTDTGTVQTGDGIPDSVVSRDPDNNVLSSSDDVRGVKFDTNESWPSIQGEISSNTQSATTAHVTETDGTVIDSIDISTLSSGDVFTFNDINLSSGTYYMLLDNPESRYDVDVGFDNEASNPYTDTDGDLSIEAGVFNVFENGGSEVAGYTYNIIRLGNINL